MDNNFYQEKVSGHCDKCGSVHAMVFEDGEGKSKKTEWICFDCFNQQSKIKSSIKLSELTEDARRGALYGYNVRKALFYGSEPDYDSLTEQFFPLKYLEERERKYSARERENPRKIVHKEHESLGDFAKTFVKNKEMEEENA